MKILLYFLNRNWTRGFTLLELMLASMMTFFVVSATGYAILVMTRENMASEVSGDLRFNADRATEFIVDEIRQATFLSTSSANIPTTPTPSCAMQTGQQFVMGLAIESSDVNVVYYTQTPPDSPWLGPSSIYRCGPPLTSSGQFGTGRTKSILIDSISVASDIRNGACPSGTTKFPTNPNAGFFLCVNNGNPNLVQLRLTAASDELASRGMTTTEGQGRFDSKATYSVVTTAFTRAGVETVALTESGVCTGVINVAVDGRPAVSFTTGMTVVATRTSPMVFSPGTWAKATDTPSTSQDSYTSGACTVIASF